MGNDNKHEAVDVEEQNDTDTATNEWRSCCFTTDKNAVQFGGQLCVSLLVIMFCMFQLFYNEDCNSQALYTGILMTVVGVWVPTPTFKQ